VDRHVAELINLDLESEVVGDERRVVVVLRLGIRKATCVASWRMDSGWQGTTEGRRGNWAASTYS
jgi:hypothetical protein